MRDRVYQESVAASDEACGFFDGPCGFRVRGFVGPRIARCVYRALLIVVGLGAVANGVVAFRHGLFPGLLGLFVLSPLGWLVVAVIARTAIESVVAAMLVAQNPRGMLALMRECGLHDEPSSPAA